MVGCGWGAVEGDVRYVWLCWLGVWVARWEFAEVALVVFAYGRGKWRWGTVACGVIEIEVGYALLLEMLEYAVFAGG